jgi:hypothetical protein
MSIMVRAVSTNKAVGGCFGILGLALLGCGGADSSIAPPPQPTPHFTIDVRYLSTLTADQKSLIGAAADKWTHALLKDMGSFQLNSAANYCFAGEPAIKELHHNLLLFVSVDQIDGPHGTLAYTQVCGQSTRDSLPIVSYIRIDAADIDSLEIRGVLASVVTHEMGHALGFNPMVWGRKGLVGGGFNDPYFDGVSAKTEFARLFPAYAGNTVPLEDVGHLGTQSSHWRWSVFGDELMIGELAPGYHYPLSAVTLGLFRDIGYEVDMTVAEPYPALSSNSARAASFIMTLDDDIVMPKRSFLLRPVTQP